ncbi:MAG: anthranilate phosphoribosyltransferase [Bifidobacteriales bacterium]|nr:anthranilate phosphoribosyltransferase [Bifidobacteriales bacterium]
MRPLTWKSILNSLVSGRHLSADETEWYMNDLMDGNADPVQVGAVLSMQSALGLTSQEVEGAAKAMVGHAVPLKVSGDVTDIVGTGGDGAATVNLSTMGAIVAAAAGVRIVKHGNRAASSKSGTADCLEQLGLPLDLKPRDVANMADRFGITFAFAKTFHPAMRFVGPVRSALGIPTVFNLLGPLTNPAQPSHVAIGCAQRQLSPMMAQVYASRGQEGMVYTSAEGLDEMAPTGPVSIWEIRRGQVEERTFDPTRELGIDPVDINDLRGGDPAFNAGVVRDFLAGKPVPSRSTALLNAASAIVADGSLINAGPGADLTSRFAQAYHLAEEAVDQGRAASLLASWVEGARAARSRYEQD